MQQLHVIAIIAVILTLLFIMYRRGWLAKIRFSMFGGTEETSARKKNVYKWA